jgi:hypothetical protein
MVLKVAVPGNTNLAAGDLVKLNIPSYESINDASNRIYDLYLSGRYIVTEVVHSINEVNYVTTFTCVRNDVKIPYPRTDESLESRIGTIETRRGAINVNTAPASTDDDDMGGV